MDRIDTAFWITGKGLSDSPHRNQLSDSESKKVRANAVQLEDFLRLLKDATSLKKGRKWVLKVLVTSHSDHEKLSRAYGGRPRSDEDNEEERVFDGKGWVELSV
jgi:hypothetical protein